MRRSILLAVPVCAALVALPALPASAVVDTQTWTSPTHQWWTSGTWSSGEVPENGDTLIFPATSSTQSDANVGNISLAAMRFTGDHYLGSAAPSGVITLTGTTGLEVTDAEGGADVTLNNDLATSGTQTWVVAAGSTLQLPALVTVDAAGSLELDIDGLVTSTGNINGQFTGLVTKTGSGTLVRAGGSGGAIGGGGLNVQEGTLFLDSVSHGTAYQVSGGTLGGDGVVDSITVTDGVIRPNDYNVGFYGILVGANGVTLDGGTYEVNLDGVTDAVSYLTAGNGILAGSGTRLDFNLESLPTVGEQYEVAGVQFGTIASDFRFLSPAGATLEDGDEFVAAGQRWSIDYAEGVVIVEYLGVAPVDGPEPPVDEEEEETLPDTGVADATLGGAAAAVALLALGGGLLVLRRRATV